MFESDVYGGCAKLLCLLRTYVPFADTALRAHRALDDSLALRDVLTYAAQAHGISVEQLLQCVIREGDLTTSVRETNALIQSSSLMTMSEVGSSAPRTEH